MGMNNWDTPATFEREIPKERTITLDFFQGEERVGAARITDVPVGAFCAISRIGAERPGITRIEIRGPDDEILFALPPRKSAIDALRDENARLEALSPKPESVPAYEPTTTLDDLRELMTVIPPSADLFLKIRRAVNELIMIRSRPKDIGDFGGIRIRGGGASPPAECEKG